MLRRDLASTAQAILRWTWVAVLSGVTAICVALAPATGLFTLPLALTAGGLALWLARGGPQAEPDRLASALVAVGMAAMVLLLVALVAA